MIRYGWLELRRVLLSLKFWVLVALYAISVLLPAYTDITMTSTTPPIAYFWVIGFNQTSVVIVLITLATQVSSDQLIRDLEHGADRYFTMKMGSACYLLYKLLLMIVSSGLVAGVANVLAWGVIALRFPLVGSNQQIQAQLSNVLAGGQLLGTYPWLFYLWQLTVKSLEVAFYVMPCFLVSLWSHNRLVSTLMPLVTYSAFAFLRVIGIRHTLLDPNFLFTNYRYVENMLSSSFGWTHPISAMALTLMIMLLFVYVVWKVSYVVYRQKRLGRW